MTTSREVPARPSSRIAALDGLRGVAALVVVINHCLLVWSVLAGPEYTEEPIPGGNFAWWLTHTPLHLFWAGAEAVCLFFVLSGLVLTLATRRLAFSWRGYFASRLVRLYLPVWASVLLAVAWYLVARHDPAAGLGPWLDAHVGVLTAQNVIGDLVLLGGASTLNGPLWSLRWEVLFSLALPAYVLAARRWPRLWPVVLAATVLTIGVGAGTGRELLFYMPMFMLGVLIADHLASLRALAGKVESRRHPAVVWGCVLTACLLALVAYWPAMALGLSGPALHAFKLLGAVAAAGIVVLAAIWPAAQQLLTRRPVRWLGTISFSLYLIHEPVVVSVAFALRDAPLILVPVISLPVSLLYAWGFYRLVEARSHRLASRLGSRWVRTPGR